MGVLSVHDEGEGLDPEAASQVFERFFRGDPSRSSSTGGAGLGLSIVAAIVQAHGGTVRVVAPESDATGTTFEVRLPLEADAGEPTEVELPAPPG